MAAAMMRTPWTRSSVWSVGLATMSHTSSSAMVRTHLPILTSNSLRRPQCPVRILALSMSSYVDQVVTAHATHTVPICRASRRKPGSVRLASAHSSRRDAARGAPAQSSRRPQPQAEQTGAPSRGRIAAPQLPPQAVRADPGGGGAHRWPLTLA